MPVWFIISLILLTFALVALLASFVMSEADAKGGARILAAFCGVVGLLCAGISSFNTVDIKSVGIVTSFNKPTGDVTGSGAVWVASWNKVGEWDAGNQKYDHIGNGEGWDNRVRVRTATLADAWVHVLIQWKVKPDQAPEQYMAYKGNFEEFKGQRVGVQLDTAVNDAFADYNPLANLKITTDGAVPVDDRAKYAQKIKVKAIERLGSDVEILSVAVVRVDHDSKTEDNIKQFNDKLALGRNLDQDKINADKAKAITDKNSGRDKQAWCLEIAEKSGTDPGLCLAGASSVIVDSRKK